MVKIWGNPKPLYTTFVFSWLIIVTPLKMVIFRLVSNRTRPNFHDLLVHHQTTNRPTVRALEFRVARYEFRPIQHSANATATTQLLLVLPLSHIPRLPLCSTKKQ